MKINPEDFKNWDDYYWHYQQTLAARYLIPMLAKAGVTLTDSAILEIGCGNGGVIEALSEKASKAIGIDIRGFDRSLNGTDKVRYITADVFDVQARKLYAGQYDIIILRDVIEHLPDKHSVFRLFQELLTDQGCILLTFPPYYSPFGAHQQVFSKTLLGKLPYTHLMPESLYLKWVKSVEKNNAEAYAMAIEMEKAKTTIRQIKKMIRQYSFEETLQEYYFIRPSYEIRYGFKPCKAYCMKYLPLIREMFVLGVYMILRRAKKS